MTIPFARPSITQTEYDAVLAALKEGAVGGNGRFGVQVEHCLTEYLHVKHTLLTTSCTHALEIAMMVLNIGSGDEVILPSFAFVSAATAILRQGARPVFAEINETTFNIDPADVLRRITPRTKTILVVHYAGVGCNMAEFRSIAALHNLFLIEDAAHALGATYMGQPLGTHGHIGCFSFHSSKNIVAGEGGAFVTNDGTLAQRAEIIREKGTNRSQFLRGGVDKYTWVDIGSSYVISDLLAALLQAQLKRLVDITQARRKIWWRYYDQMADMEARELVIRPGLDPRANHNGHIYGFRVIGGQRDAVLKYLQARGVGATFHFIPLHSSPYGLKHLGYKAGDFPITEQVSSSLIRLPLYPDLSVEDADYVLGVLESALKLTSSTSSYLKAKALHSVGSMTF